jgi:hypothetical protein
MHNNFFWKKGMVFFIILLLIFATSPIIYSKKNSDYNLKIKIRVWDNPKPWGSQFLFFNHSTDITFHIDVYNEGPNHCDNFYVKIDQIFIYDRGSIPSDWFYLFFSGEYEGSKIKPGNKGSIEITNDIGAGGLWMAKATIISVDNNIEDNIARWFYYVV